MFNSSFSDPEDLVAELAAQHRADFCSKESLFDMLPCLGWPIISRTVDALVAQGRMKMVIPPGGGAKGRYCHSLRVSDSRLKRLGLAAIRPSRLRGLTLAVKDSLG